MHVSQRLARSRPLATTAMHCRVAALRAAGDSATLRRGLAALLAFGAAWHDGGA